MSIDLYVGPTHLCPVDSSILEIWNNPFSIEGMLSTHRVSMKLIDSRADLDQSPHSAK